MQKEDVARLAIGSLILLIPFLGSFTIIPLAIIHLLYRPTKTLTAAFIILLLLRWTLGLTHLDLPLYVVTASFIAPTFAYAASKRFESLPGSIIYVMTMVALGYPVAMFISPDMAPERVLFISMLGGTSGAFLQHVSKEGDFIVPFGSCMVMWLFSFDYPLPELGKILMIYVFALALGLGAYWAHAADVDAVLSEVIICILVVLFSGMPWFLLLLAFYLLGGAFTRYKYEQKQKNGVAQARGGVRGYKNVYSNSLVPLALAIGYGLYGADFFLYGFIGAVATANGDTLASEVGETSRSAPRMITTLKPVETGVDGGVTPLGEFAALLGSAVIGVLAMLTSMVPYQGFVIAVLAGFLGTNFDSLLGGTLQQKGTLTNNGVNLFATLFGGLAGGIIWYLLWG